MTRRKFKVGLSAPPRILIVSMLALRDLPQRKHLRSLQQEFPELNIARMQAYLTLLKTSTDVVKRVDAYLLTHGLQQNRFTILVVLYRDPGQPKQAHEIADSIGVRRPTVTGLLDGLERQGWIERDADPADRRGVLVQITQSGIAFLRSVLPGYYALINGTFEGLSAADYAALCALLAKIKA